MSQAGSVEKKKRKVDELEIAAWTPENLPPSFQVTKYRMSTSAHNTLMGWANEKSTRDVSLNFCLRGLSEVLAALAPEISYMKIEKDYEIDAARLQIFILGDSTQNSWLRKRIQAGFDYWLRAIYTDRPSDTRQTIAATVLDDENWSTYSVSTELVASPGKCPRPKNYQLFDILCAFAVKSLSGKQIRFPEGETKFLVPQTPQSTPYNGIEMVAFPPQKDPKDHYWWSEVVRITTATFPERPGIYILAKPSMRNWGPVRTSSHPKRNRHMDVFFPSVSDSGETTYWHSSFAYKSRRSDDKTSPLLAKWVHKDSERLYEMIRFLSNSTMPIPNDGILPVADLGGLRVLPRLSNSHKDDMPGGTGVGWPDRLAIAESLDPHMEAAGFKREASLHRISPRSLKAAEGGYSFENEFSGAKGVHLRMKHLAKALVASGNPEKVLDFHILNLRDDTPDAIVEKFIEMFGKPTSNEGLKLHYADDDVRIHFQVANAGLFSKEIPEPALTDTELAQFNKSQQVKILTEKRREGLAAVESAMHEQLKILRQNRTTIGCAIVERSLSSWHHDV